MSINDLPSGYWTVIGLAIIMGLVLLLPFSVKKVEEELEAFLFIMGLSAVTVSQTWSRHLIVHALKEPLMISGAVLIVGFLFRVFRDKIGRAVFVLIRRTGFPFSIFLVVCILGLSSSIITAIIAALILSEIISVLDLDRKCEIKLVVYACFAIGMGAALTPIGEPLSTIVVSNLRGVPHNADFIFLFKLLAIWVIPGVILMAVLSAATKGKKIHTSQSVKSEKKETNKSIVLRAFKVYLFVMALVFLGSGIRPLAEITITKVPDWQLYWINTLSAVLDNATLAAAEIVPSMSRSKLTFILVGLLISGGMLIPGNIPNIICASKLKIKSREWAKVALPLGAILMSVYFVVLYFLV
jgi:predicted cation transporter